MRLIPAVLATSMSGFFIAACSDPLGTPVTCFHNASEMCGRDELCTDQSVGAADDAGTTFSCTHVSVACDVPNDCSGSACPECIAALCHAPANRPTLQGRYLTCAF